TIDVTHKEVIDPFKCPYCNSQLQKNDLERKKNGKNRTVQMPTAIIYKHRLKRYNKKPDTDDLELIKKIEELEIPYWFPEFALPEGYNTGQPKKSHGIEKTFEFYTRRNLWVLSSIFSKIRSIEDMRIRKIYYSLFVAILNGTSKMARVSTSNYLHGGGGPFLTGLRGTLYIPSFSVEKRPAFSFKNRFDKFIRAFSDLEFQGKTIISTQSATNLKNIPDNSVDYIFTDPPFGANLMYSELSFIWESWFKVFTNNEHEAIINDYQNKDLTEYTNLMSSSFKEMCRILKPNRWITVEFHNTQASVWNSIQEAMNRAGFIICQVTVLDKKQGSFKQVTSAGAVKNDLIINAYKPKREFSEQFLKNAGEGMEIDFVIQQLEHLPAKQNIERTEKMLYSKMLAHYVENGFKIKYDSTNFYKLLSDNLVELDGYWFLDSQVKEYNKWKSGLSLEQIKDVLKGQQVLFVSDEKSALAWLYNFLHQPRKYGEIYTAYQQVATTTDDNIPELKELLDNNFIVENGKYRRPISREEREDINKNRERELNRTFQNLLKQAMEQKGRIRNVRREALIYGFTKCYQEGRYQDILTVASRLYASTLEASGDIMDFVDIARIKTSGEEKKQRTIDSEFLLWR
ncbi:DNA methylase, partial [Candidatus Heimdallarchaeota archaeon B3_Heim]